MLELKKITKEYKSGDTTVKALKGLNLTFRENEFVSILGQSGCGKTTLLNIIGGLDKYTAGDLIINGKSTTKFKEKDWDIYRNHSVGFVFQNYNLIPHQTVLANVELALTLAGMSKTERRKKAIKALKDVGLGDQLHKKPNQMSGGQMQRVAIARALVSDPDILLADEPTGALDSKTSLQIMNLLKDIAKDRLVIMVTHNPELAAEYSTRIIKLLDGKVVDDTMPYQKEEPLLPKVPQRITKTFMSYQTAISLSLNNLMTKKGRTILTSLAGSIGIIGIALIMSLSHGMQSYIDKIEQDTLSSYPLTIEESSIDMGTVVQAFMEMGNSTAGDHDLDNIYSKSVMNDVMNKISNQVQSNNLEAFKKYITSEDCSLANYATIEYGYNVNLNLYRTFENNRYYQSNPNTIMEELGLNNNEQMAMSSTSVFEKLPTDSKTIAEKYELISGRYPQEPSDLLLLVDENNEISDYTLYALGLLSIDELKENFQGMLNGKDFEELETKKYSYEDLLETSFKLVLDTDYYQKENGIWLDQRDNEEYMTKVLDNALDLKIVGLVKINPETNIDSSLSNYGGVLYNPSLEAYIIDSINETEIVQDQKENSELNIFTGLKFSERLDVNNLTSEQQAYLQTLSQEQLTEFMLNYSENSSATYESNLYKLGAVNYEQPSTISLYPKDFEAKAEITKIIEDYNQTQKDQGQDENVISYSDIVGTMMSSVTNIIDIISYVLIAFVSISLVVSSIMIGIITYISVLERTKEIGILRSLGASQKDVARVFNAETMIIGLTAGSLGIIITLLLNIPINYIIKVITDVSDIASLPIKGAVILIAISTILTLIAGLIPSRMASKKDPVEALRTE